MFVELRNFMYSCKCILYLYKKYLLCTLHLYSGWSVGSASKPRPNAAINPLCRGIWGGVVSPVLTQTVPDLYSVYKCALHSYNPTPEVALYKVIKLSIEYPCPPTGCSPFTEQLQWLVLRSGSKSRMGGQFVKGVSQRLVGIRCWYPYNRIQSAPLGWYTSCSGLLIYASKTSLLWRL